MKTLIFLLLLSSASFAQNDINFTGDWLLPFMKETLIPLQVFKLEPFSEETYVGALESEIYPISLYKVRVFKVKGKLFLDMIELNKEQENQHYFWAVQKVFEDSAQVSLYANFPIDLGNKDIINKNGQVLRIDTTKIDFDLIYSESSNEYIAKENTWKAPSNLRRVVFFAQNPLLFEYLIQKYKHRIKGRLFTYYRWSFFTWDKVNTLKSKDIISITRLDRHKVFSIFETATIEELMPFKVKEKSAEEIKKVALFLDNYHLVRANSVSFMKSPSFWIVSFKDGRKIKVKTNLRRKGLYDATNKKLYSTEQQIYW